MFAVKDAVDGYFNERDTHRTLEAGCDMAWGYHASGVDAFIARRMGPLIASGAFHHGETH